MRTEAMIEAINAVLRKDIKCEDCIFDCKGYKGKSLCTLSAVARDLETLQNHARISGKLMREAVDDLKDADMIDCCHCLHYDAMDTQKCEEADCVCSKCEQDCACRHCIDNQNWEWRGFYPKEGANKQ